MNSVFIKVPVSERLPAESGFYLTNKGHLHFLSGCKRFMTHDPQWWLQEVALPTEEEIIQKEVITYGVRKEALPYESLFMTGVNFILDHVKKGGRK